MTRADITAISEGLRLARPINWSDISARTQYVRTCESVALQLQIRAAWRHWPFNRSEFLRDCGAA